MRMLCADEGGFLDLFICHLLESIKYWADSMLSRGRGMFIFRLVVILFSAV